LGLKEQSYNAQFFLPIGNARKKYRIAYIVLFNFFTGPRSPMLTEEPQIEKSCGIIEEWRA
jgi:hypothetical protein